MAPNPDIFARNRGLTLRQSLNRMASKPPFSMPAPEPPPARGGSEFKGTMQMAKRPRELPYWWPTVRRS